MDRGGVEVEALGAADGGGEVGAQAGGDLAAVRQGGDQDDLGAEGLDRDHAQVERHGAGAGHAREVLGADAEDHGAVAPGGERLAVGVGHGDRDAGEE